MTAGECGSDRQPRVAQGQQRTRGSLIATVSAVDPAHPVNTPVDGAPLGRTDALLHATEIASSVGTAVRGHAGANGSGGVRSEAWNKSQKETQKEVQKKARKRRRLLFLRGLDATLFGHRMPEAALLAEQVEWQRDQMDDSCVRCGTTLFRFESREGGCGECRGRRLLHEGVVRLGRYAPPLSQWVPAIKGRAWFGMAQFLGAELGRQVRDAVHAGRVPTPELITWVPVHWIRRLWRGIDHAEMIALATARELAVPCRSLLVARWGRGQVRSDRRQRTANSGRFRARQVRDELCGKRLLLIDDVQTTGTTAQDAFRALQGLRPASLSLAVCAVSDPPRRNALRARQKDGVGVR